MKTKMYMVLLAGLLFIPGMVKAADETAVRVAALPFEFFSGEKKSALGTEVALKLLRQLSRNPLILTPDIKDIQSVVSKDEPATPHEERLREIAKLLDVNFILFGSLTKVRDELSVDVQVFYNFPGDAYFKTFAQGREIEKIVEELARKLELEIMDKAELIPPAQRPKGKVVRKTLPDETLKADVDVAEYEKEVDRELAAEQESAALHEKVNKKAGSLLKADEPEESELTKESTQKEIKTDGAVADSSGSHKKEPAGIKDDVQSEEEHDQGKKKGGAASFKFDQPVNINADTLEYDNKNNSAIFRGNVVARQADIVIFADLMEVAYGEKNSNKAEKGGLKQLTATGNVKAIQGERIATGQKIVFYNDEQKIVATGNPRVWQGDNVIVGNKITVYLREDRSVVEGNMQDRVSATLFPREKKPKK
ncbi:MAG: lipopolysaccharide transport periplasmic protein LptA [Pseudomonadota bacterium]